MKPAIIFFVSIAVGSIAAFAQSNSFPVSGNVGIGTTTPPASLDIQKVPGQYISNLRIFENATGQGDNYTHFGYNYGTGAYTNYIRGQSTYIDSYLETRAGFCVTSGNVGIGTTSPSEKLELNGNIQMPGGSYICVPSGHGINISDKGNEIVTFAVRGSQGYGGRIDVYTAGDTTRNVVLDSNGISWLNGGNVGIGTTNPTEKLSVNGRIRAREVVVETTNWSDYVLAKDHKLTPLAEVEKHIEKEGHLPGVPSAQEVADKGVSVGEMQAILLAKIEELTLHVIQQEKDQQAQQKELVAQQAQIEAQATKITALESENTQLKSLLK